jgi:hypothetical protein
MSRAFVLCVIVGLGFSGLSGCHLMSAPRAAVIGSGDRQAEGRLRAALEKELGRSPLDLGPSDPSRGSVITVLPVPPGPLEDRSLVLPSVFHLQIRGGVCGLLREETGAFIPLSDVRCVAFRD